MILQNGLADLGLGQTSPFQQYGQRVAEKIMTSVVNLPPAQRSSALKRTMDAIDPTLFSRANAYGDVARRQGQSANDALMAGIATAVSEGILAELHAIGVAQSGGALGATVQLDPSLFTHAQSVAQPLPVFCDGYSWESGGWSHTRIGQADLPAPYGTRCPAGAREHTGGDATHTVDIDPEVLRANQTQVTANPHSAMQVGPFTLPLDAKEVRIHTTLTDEQRAFIIDNLKTATTAGAYGGPGVTVNIKNGRYPFVKFRFPKVKDNPNSEKMFGLYIVSHDAAASIDDISLVWKEYVPSDSLFESIWKGIKWVVSAVVDVVVDIVKGIKDLTCELVGSSGAAASAGAAGGPVGVGIAVAAATCAKPGPTPPPYVPPPPSTGPSMLMIALGLLGVGAIAVLATKRKTA